MKIRRRVDLRTVVLEADVIGDRRLSAAALGVYGYLAAGADDGRTRESILRRFEMTAAQLDACLDELREAGHLDGPSGSAVGPMPPERRRRAYRKPWIPASAKALLRAIADEADAEGRATPLNRDLAEETGQAARTVARNLTILEGKGLLRRETVDRGAEGYLRLIWIRGPLPTDEPPAGPVLQ